MGRKTLQLKKIKINWPEALCKTEGVSAEICEGFIGECAENNRIPAIVILFMALAMECLMVVLYLLNSFFIKKGRFFPQYIYMYLSMILASACLLFLFFAAKHSTKRLMRLELAMVTILSLWSGVFSAFDVMNGFSSYLFVQLMMINSIIIKLNPRCHCAANAAGYLVYAALILYAHLNITITFVELINPFFMFVAACVVIILNNRTKLKSYMNQKLVQEQNKRLEFYANNDFLTKIANRKSIIEYLEKIISAKHKNIACMMIDIDDFKLYNDTYGHIMGDRCLIKLCAAIEKYILSQGGKVGRFGGEEFLVLLTDKQEDDVISIANGLVRTAREQNIEFSTSRIAPMVTISIGVHLQNNTQNADEETMLISADRALYQAKSEGKNRIAVAFD